MTKILIIEDHDEMRHLLVGQVELLGFVAVSARNAENGVNSAVAEIPDLILMDFMMPRIDGLKVTQMLRAHPKTSRIPILVASAFSSGSDVETCMQAGCTNYIAKPFTYNELRRKICGLIGSSYVGP